MRRKKIGIKDFHGSVDITDPCYSRDVWCRMNDMKIKEGEYTCMVWYHTAKGDCNGKPYAYKVVGIIGIHLTILQRPVFLINSRLGPGRILPQQTRLR